MDGGIVPAPAPAPVPDDVDIARHPSGIVPTLQNVVATVNLNCKLDLKEIALHARNAEYNPKRFAAVIMRIREPKTTALIFASGKMVCTGAKSESDSRLAARKYARIVQKLGFQATFKEFKIQNIVGSCDVKFPIRLEGINYQHGLFCSYEPELFPGLIYRMKHPKIVLLIFVSGKVVLTGAKKREEIYDAFENIYPILQEFRKGNPRVADLQGMHPPPPPEEIKRDAMLAHQQDAPAASIFPPGSASYLPPPTPLAAGTPYNYAASVHDLPAPTPLMDHHGLGLPPPTPLHQHHSMSMAAPTPRNPPMIPYLPPPTPLHNSLSMQAPTPYSHHLPPPTPLHPSSSHH